jgi:hypothetical protein
MTVDARFLSPSGLVTPAQSIVALSASANAIQVTRGLYIGVAGTINITDAEGVDTDNIPVVAGAILPWQITKLRAVSSATVYALR